MILCRAVSVVVNDGGHVTKDGGVQQRRDDHHAAAERLLVVGRCGHVAETDGRHAGHREVQCRDVHADDWWTTLDVYIRFVAGRIDVDKVEWFAGHVCLWKSHFIGLIFALGRCNKNVLMGYFFYCKLDIKYFQMKYMHVCACMCSKSQSL